MSPLSIASPALKTSPPPSPERGDIYWIKIPQSQVVGSEQYKRRPWAVVSTKTLTQMGMVIALPLSMKANQQNRQFRILVLNSDIVYEPGTTLIQGDRVALTHQLRALSVE